jgi:hypothetical protein
MRLTIAACLGLALALTFAMPVFGATDTPQAQEGLPIGLALVVIAGALVGAYLFVRPSRLTGRKD